MNRPTDPTLEPFISGWLLAKSDEAAAKQRRIDIEKAIIAITGKRADAGQMTVDAPGAKITIKTNFSLSLDWDKFDNELAARIPAHKHPIKTKRELDEAGVKWMQANDPASYLVLSEGLTRKENKPTVEITLL